jgi:hypothetical protein
MCVRQALHQASEWHYTKRVIFNVKNGISYYTKWKFAVLNFRQVFYIVIPEDGLSQSETSSNSSLQTDDI